MMLFKYLCCRDSPKATITTGELKQLGGTTVLEVNIQLSLGAIVPSTDFLYLQPHSEQRCSLDPHSRPTASTQVTGPDDLALLPKRLRDVHKSRVVLVEKGSALCESVGVAYIDFMRADRGRYRLYYMRIENEKRIMYNSRLEVLGASSAFSVNNHVSDGRQEAPKQVSFNDSSELDSVVLMQQIAGGGVLSNSNSVHSSDQTQAAFLTPNQNNSFTASRRGIHGASLLDSSNASSGSIVTYVIKNENDETVLYSKPQTPKHHRRSGANVLEEVNQLRHNQADWRPTLGLKRTIRGKENEAERIYGAISKHSSP